MYPRHRYHGATTIGACIPLPVKTYRGSRSHYNFMLATPEVEYGCDLLVFCFSQLTNFTQTLACAVYGQRALCQKKKVPIFNSGVPMEARVTNN